MATMVRKPPGELKPGDQISDVQGRIHTVVSVEQGVETELWNPASGEFDGVEVGWLVKTDTYPAGQFAGSDALYEVL